MKLTRKVSFRLQPLIVTTIAVALRRPSHKKIVFRTSNHRQKVAPFLIRPCSNKEISEKI